jgi:hypothetical protein
MTNIEIWRQLTERHEDWNNPDHIVKLRARGLKALIDQAYQCGKENSIDNNFPNELYKQIFGNKK